MTQLEVLQKILKDPILNKLVKVKTPWNHELVPIKNIIVVDGEVYFEIKTPDKIGLKFNSHWDYLVFQDIRGNIHSVVTFSNREWNILFDSKTLQHISQGVTDSFNYAVVPCPNNRAIFLQPDENGDLEHILDFKYIGDKIQIHALDNSFQINLYTYSREALEEVLYTVIQLPESA